MADTKRKPRLSPSASAKYNQCPRSWKFRYIDGIKEPSGRAALLGTFVHRILELLYELPAAERTLDSARKCGAKAWPETLEEPDFGLLEFDDAEQRAFKHDAWALVNTYFEMEDPAKMEPLSLEQELDVDVDGVPFFGYIDRVEADGEGRVVTDYKTGKSPKPQYAGDKLDQVNSYAVALEATDGKPVTGVRIIFLGDGKELTAPVTPEVVTETKVHLRTTWDRINASKKSGEFEHSVGPLCGWCFYVDSCEPGADEVRRRFDMGRMRDSAPAVATLGLN